MYDPTPAPFGDVTRRWTQLDDATRTDHAGRLIGDGCADGHLGHVDRPGRDLGDCYMRLVTAAIAGDDIAVAWLATTHRPLLLARGLALFEHDPSEWGAVCLEVLHTTLTKVDVSAGRWLRRRIAEQLGHRVSRVVADYLTRRRRERPTAPTVLHTKGTGAVTRTRRWDPHPELTAALDRALADLDPPTRDALWALARHRPLVEVADRYDLSYDAIRQRVSRARRRLRPELAAFHRDDR